MFKKWVAVASLLVLSLGFAPSAYADGDVFRFRASSRGRTWVVDVIEDRARAHGTGTWALKATAWCESRMDPGAVGDEGEKGLFQLHAGGLLPYFYKMGYKNPYNPWEAADFAARMFSMGEAKHWSCFWTDVLGRRPPWWT